jgi:hypothetical protein
MKGFREEAHSVVGRTFQPCPWSKAVNQGFEVGTRSYTYEASISQDMQVAGAHCGGTYSRAAAS